MAARARSKSNGGADASKGAGKNGRGKTRKPSGASAEAARKSASGASSRSTRKSPANTASVAANPLFDDTARRLIRSIVIALLALVLLVVALVPGTGMVSGAVSNALHLALGLGCYILPVFLLFVAFGTYFGHRVERLPARLCVGLLLVFIALLGLLARISFETEAQLLSSLFLADYLVVRGGYLGSGIVWAGITLFGEVITTVVLLGICAVGLFILGYSIKQVAECIASGRADAAERSGQDAVPEARIRRGAEYGGDAPNLHDAETSVLDRAERERAEREGALRNSATRVMDRSAASSGASAPQSGEAKQGKAAHRDTGKQAPASAKPRLSRKKAATALPTPTEDFELPPLSVLGVSPKVEKGSAEEAALKETASSLQGTLEDFGIMATVVGWVPGPTVTLFKVDLPAGVRVSRVTALGDDIALALAAPGVRIFSPVPGTNYVGIEVPNTIRQTVLLGDVLPAAGAGPLQIAIGKDVEGNSIVSDLAKMPHLLIGGTTGSGKSVSINAMIMSILMRATPDEVRLILIDPKRVEFSLYNDIPHLYVPVVTEPKEAASALSWGVAEMDRRLKVFGKAGARNIGQYNAKVQAGELEDGNGMEMPFIVIVIDELADLMMNVGKEVEFSISRLAQLARAAGIHLIVATQRPSAKVVTGLIKSNITNRIAFNVASSIDSRVILDTPGAEALIGLGDLLFSRPETPKPQRIQGCFVSEDEINEVVDFLKEQGEPEYHSEILTTNLITIGSSSPDGAGSTDVRDPLLRQAAELVVSAGMGSTSSLQRRLSVGYARAARIMDTLEEIGVVGPQNGAKTRDVLVDPLELETIFAFEVNDNEA